MACTGPSPKPCAKESVPLGRDERMADVSLSGDSVAPATALPFAQSRRAV